MFDKINLKNQKRKEKKEPTSSGRKVEERKKDQS